MYIVLLDCILRATRKATISKYKRSIATDQWIRLKQLTYFQLQLSAANEIWPFPQKHEKIKKEQILIHSWLAAKILSIFIGSVRVFVGSLNFKGQFYGFVSSKDKEFWVDNIPLNSHLEKTYTSRKRRRFLNSLRYMHNVQMFAYICEWECK